MFGCFEWAWSKKFTITGFLGDVSGVILSILTAVMVSMSIDRINTEFGEEAGMEAYQYILGQCKAALGVTLAISLVAGCTFLASMLFSLSTLVPGAGGFLGALRFQILSELFYFSGSNQSFKNNDNDTEISVK